MNRFTTALLSILLASTAACELDTPSQPLAIPQTAPGSVTELLAWYDGLTPEQQAGVLDVVISEAEAMNGLADASLAEIRASQVELVEALEAVVGEHQLAAFPMPSPLGAAVVSRYDAGVIPMRIDDDGFPAPYLDDGGEIPGMLPYSIRSTKWNHTDLTYCVDSYDNDVSNSKQRNQYEKAGDEWAANSALTFTKVSDCSNADIKIDMKGKDHDSDGCGGFSSGSVLAHAKYPVSNQSRLYLHMNKKYDWDNVGSMSSWDKFWNPDTYDLRTVAMHELGHNIGIQHTTYSNAVMYPTIGALDTKWNLHSDDIGAVQALYGADTADLAYARTSYAQTLLARGVLVMRETVSDSTEARESLDALLEALAATDDLVQTARAAAIAGPRAADMAASAELSTAVANQTHSAWAGLRALADADGGADMGRIADLAEDAVVSLGTAAAEYQTATVK